MRRLLPALAALALALRFLDRSRDRANVRRLSAHLGVPIDEARRIYTLSRRKGFGAAYDAVLGRPEPQPTLGHDASEAGKDRG